MAKGLHCTASRQTCLSLRAAAFCKSVAYIPATCKSSVPLIAFCAWYIEGCKITPSANATEFFKQILKIAHPIIPWISETVFQELAENENKSSVMEHINENIISSDNISDFEEIINITKLLRKLAFTGNCKEFNIDADIETSKFLQFYSKLQINKELDFKFNLYGKNIWINKENAQQAKHAMQKEFHDFSKENDMLKSKIITANNVPENVLLEWKNRKSENMEYLNTLSSLINAL